jgi:hypothetical protein
VDALHDGTTNEPMGELATRTASGLGITRSLQDDYAVRSYQRAQKAAADNVFTPEICSKHLWQPFMFGDNCRQNCLFTRSSMPPTNANCPITVSLPRRQPVTVNNDEDVPKLDEQKMRQLKPVFGGKGTVL